MARVFTIAEGLENMGALKTGGQGSIYKTRRVQDDIITAIKLLPTPIYSESPTDKHFIDFQNEVQKLKKVNEVPNPHVVKILSSGITESGSLPFIEMEFIEGPDLEELLQPPYDPVFTIKETIRVAEQLSNALGHCHKVNVKHGDIKSNNVKFNEKTGNYVLLDFGMAVMSDEQRRTSLRQAGAIEFMAPEQNEGIMLFETDVYSFGIILYELLAGTVPFPLRNKSETARNRVMVDHMETPPPDLLTLRRHNMPETMGQDELKVPQWLTATIYKCLEKSPGERFRNGVELHAHIRNSNTATGHPKDWNAEQLLILQQQNEKLARQNDQLQKQLEEIQTTPPAQSYGSPLPPLSSLSSLSAEPATAWKPQEHYQPQPIKHKRNWMPGTVLLIVFLACAVGAVWIYSLKSPGKQLTQDTAAGKQPDKPAQVIGQYKVIAPRAYFHNEADENTRREAYMIPSNDVVTALKESNDFIYTEFTNNRGQTSKGWIRKQDLVTLSDWARQQKDSGTKFEALPNQEDINTQLQQARDLVADNQLDQALYIYSYLSDQGIPEAMYYYGNLALQNKNDNIDCQEAMRLLNRAAEKGYTPAKRTLGFIYLFAENRDILQMNEYERCQFERDVYKGTKLLMEAVADGDSTARRMLDEVKKWTEETPVDPNL